MNKILSEILSGIAFDSKGNKINVHSSVKEPACAQIQRLVRSSNASRTLEIGMAMGASTLAILDALHPDGQHIAIDPYQNSYDNAFGWRGVGITSVRRANLPAEFKLYEELSCIALPKLLSEGSQFDLIFIDGYHTFDYAFVDYFYSDLLLREGGILVMDDWALPHVYLVTRFIETHKAYEKIGPPIMANPFGLRHKIAHRRGTNAAWSSICAYRKIKNTQTKCDFFHSNFYPNYRVYR